MWQRVTDGAADGYAVDDNDKRLLGMDPKTSMV
jgi:hypothetical protein